MKWFPIAEEWGSSINMTMYGVVKDLVRVLSLEGMKGSEGDGDQLVVRTDPLAGIEY